MGQKKITPRSKLEADVKRLSRLAVVYMEDGALASAADRLTEAAELLRAEARARLAMIAQAAERLS